MHKEDHGFEDYLKRITKEVYRDMALGEETAQKPSNAGSKKTWKEANLDDTPDLQYKLRQLLMTHRIKSGFLQSDVAKSMGVTQAMISQYEAGKSNQTIYFVQRYAAAIGIEIKLSAEAL